MAAFMRRNMVSRKELQSVLTLQDTARENAEVAFSALLGGVFSGRGKKSHDEPLEVAVA